VPRNTAQRQAIRQVFNDTGRPLSPNEIHESAQEHLPGLGIATVYRTVNRLVDEGWLVTLDVPGEPQRYERAGKGHHHHFQCTECTRMFDFEGCPGNMASLLPKGFQLQDHEIFLYGRCPDCVK